jgi:predicted ATPase
VRFTHLHLDQIRCFPEADVALDAITVLVGPNNSGKSTILKCLALIQEGLVATPGSFGRAEATGLPTITIQLSDVQRQDFQQADAIDYRNPGLIITPTTANSATMRLTGTLADVNRDDAITKFQSIVPNNPILAFFSARRQFGYQESVSKQTGMQVSGNLSNLAQRLQRLQSRPDQWDNYVSLSDDILGFHLVPLQSPNGNLPGVVFGADSEIMVDALGDGVPSIGWMVAELMAAERKLILIEEPEHDLHPASLRKLVDLMVDAAMRNQILVTTHSHVVLNTLGAAGGRVYRVDPLTTDARAIPRSSVQLADSREERIQVLDDLGYTLADMGLYEGWIVFEEASAESVIRNLIPLFAPKLRMTRTVSGRGADRSSKLFDEYNRLFLFVHLEPRYRDKAWVILDGDDAGRGAIQRLHERYTSWSADHFRTWSVVNFEQFYPARFHDRVATTLALEGEGKRAAKGDLAKDVAEWITQEPDAAAKEFIESASEVVATLREIEANLFRS